MVPWTKSSCHSVDLVGKMFFVSWIACLHSSINATKTRKIIEVQVSRIGRSFQIDQAMRSIIQQLRLFLSNRVVILSRAYLKVPGATSYYRLGFYT